MNDTEDFHILIDSKLEIIKQIYEEQINDFTEIDNYFVEKLDCINQQKTTLEENKSSMLLAIDQAKTHRDKLAQLCADRRNESNDLKNNYNMLDLKYKSLLKEYENLEEQCLMLKSKLKLSPHDQLTLDLNKKKLELYGQATNIVWDYSDPINSNISGCVINKSKNYLQSFMFKKDELSAAEVREKLWIEIEKSLVENDENKPDNFL